MGIQEGFLTDEEALPASHREALIDAIDILVDQFAEDVMTLSDATHGASPPPFEDTWMAAHLPQRYAHRYDAMFAKKFLVCLITVAWKLRSSEPHLLACTAEELALYALLQESTALLETKMVPVDFRAFEDRAFEDMDFELLFDPAWDGIEDYGNEMTEGSLGFAHLRYDDWFRPFHVDVPVHPYVEPRS